MTNELAARRTPMTPDFVAATANIHWSAKRGEVKELVTHLRDEEEASLIFGQEFPRLEQRAALRAAGYQFFFHPRQFVVAILPDIWSCSRARGYDLGPEYGIAGKKGEKQQTGVQMAVLMHRELDLSVKAYSAHPPSGVQDSGGPRDDEAPNRVDALRFLVNHFERKNDRRNTDAFLVGVDDNADETKKAQQGEWEFMPPWQGPALDRPGLKQCQPPVGSHGAREEGGRKIDPFYYDGLTPGDGKVLWDLAPGDHGPHVRPWVFTANKRRR
jgi:hypothetical protein